MTGRRMEADSPTQALVTIVDQAPTTGVASIVVQAKVPTAGVASIMVQARSSIVRFMAEAACMPAMLGAGRGTIQEVIAILALILI
jgi:hypothetical protein